MATTVWSSIATGYVTISSDEVTRVDNSSGNYYGAYSSVAIDDGTTTVSTGSSGRPFVFGASSSPTTGDGSFPGGSIQFGFYVGTGGTTTGFRIIEDGVTLASYDTVTFTNTTEFKIDLSGSTCVYTVGGVDYSTGATLSTTGTFYQMCSIYERNGQILTSVYNTGGPTPSTGTVFPPPPIAVIGGH